MDNVTLSGINLELANKVAIMVHGRGADTHSILRLKTDLDLEDFCLLAPQAPDHTWYPYSFMAPEKDNEPHLTQSIDQIDRLFNAVLKSGKESRQIYFMGFSQGACLCLEYVARHARRYGGIIAFTGGLIGEDIEEEKYTGDFEDTPIFIGASYRDFHVPLTRVKATSVLLERMGAEVKTMIFEDTMHTIRQQEVDWVKDNILHT